MGLDLSPARRPSRRAQLRIFEAILSDPRATALPLTIHSRSAELETIKRLAQAGAPHAILHRYTGPLALLVGAHGMFPGSAHVMGPTPVC
ncbi:TatD family hydrolase [Streptomyces sp. NPDC047042]|uniref:TatD family hydrolase n=1 Tax=Streptomyces sp. NPDC047042 TaxID=3154807 RepID=UPI0033E03E9D